MYNKGNETRNDVNMSFDDFVAELRASVEKLLDGSVKVILTTVEKVNYHSMKTLTILYPGDNNTSPAMNLDLFYEEYKRGTDMDSIARQVIALHGEERCPGNTNYDYGILSSDLRDFA